MKHIFYLLLVCFSLKSFAQNYTDLAKDKITKIRLDSFIIAVKQLFEEQTEQYAPIYEEYLLNKDQKAKQDLEKFIDKKILHDKVIKLLNNICSNIDKKTYEDITRGCINSDCLCHAHIGNCIWFGLFGAPAIILTVLAAGTENKILYIYAGIIAGIAFLPSAVTVITQEIICRKESTINNAIEDVDFKHNNPVLNKFSVREHLIDAIALLKREILDYITERQMSTYQSKYFYQFKNIYDEYIILLDEVKNEIVINNC